MFIWIIACIMHVRVGDNNSICNLWPELQTLEWQEASLFPMHAHIHTHTRACTHAYKTVPLCPAFLLPSPTCRTGRALREQKERGFGKLGARIASHTWWSVWGFPGELPQNGGAGECVGARDPRFLHLGGRRLRRDSCCSEHGRIYSISCCCCMASLTTSPSRVSIVLMVTVFLVWTSALLWSGLVSR